METADHEWEQEFTESQHSLDALEAQASDMEARADQVFTDLEARVAATDNELRQTVNQLARRRGTRPATHLAQGLEPYIAAAFAALDGHVEREATPFVMDAFADLARDVTRARSTSTTRSSSRPRRTWCRPRTRCWRTPRARPRKLRAGHADVEPALRAGRLAPAGR